MPRALARLLAVALLLMPLLAAAQAAGPVEGTDYEVIAGGTPYAPRAGRIEVVEVFGYACPACARFEPDFAAWKAKQARDVDVVAVAAPFGGAWDPFARAYYAARALGVADRTHRAVFDAIHRDGTLPRNATDDELAAFYATQGVDAARFARAMAGDAVRAETQRARDFIVRSGVTGTPMLVVAGKYRVIGADRLRIVDQLVARERSARR